MRGRPIWSTICACRRSGMARRVAVPGASVDVRRDGAPVARESVAPERLAPDREQVAERPAVAAHLDHAGGLARHDRLPRRRRSGRTASCRPTAGGCRSPTAPAPPTPSTNSSRCTPCGVPAGFPHGSCGEATAPASEREPVADADRPRLLARIPRRRIPPQADWWRLRQLPAGTSPGRTRTVRPNARGRGQGKRPPSMGHSASPGVRFPQHERRRPESNWCGRLCRPLPNHSATSPRPAPVYPRALRRRCTHRGRTACENQRDGGGGSGQPEGWRRQDDDGRQRGRRARARRASGRCSSTSIRRARPAARCRCRSTTGAARARCSRRRASRPSSTPRTRRCSGSACCPPTSTLAGVEAALLADTRRRARLGDGLGPRSATTGR